MIPAKFPTEVWNGSTEATAPNDFRDFDHNRMRAEIIAMQSYILNGLPDKTNHSGEYLRSDGWKPVTNLGDPVAIETNVLHEDTQIGFFGATPIPKPDVDMTNGDADDKLLRLATALENLGLITRT
jgi:hypothetical protein